MSATLNDEDEKLPDDPAVLKRKIKRLRLQIQELNQAGDKIEQLKEAETKVKALDNFKPATEIPQMFEFEIVKEAQMKQVLLVLRDRIAARRGKVSIQVNRQTGDVDAKLSFPPS